MKLNTQEIKDIGGLIYQVVCNKLGCGADDFAYEIAKSCRAEIRDYLEVIEGEDKQMEEKFQEGLRILSKLEAE